MRTITLETAGRLALVRQHLAGARPANDANGILDVVRDLGCVQIDPISVVARSHTLVLWSRIGPYDLEHLDRLLWQERSLFEYWAHAASIVPTDDYAIHRRLMRTYAMEKPTTRVGRRFHAWLADNAGLRRHILTELRRRGPLPARAFEDKAEAEWYSTGWTSGRNVSQMLDYLWTKGQIMVAGRAGLQKLWDLSERCLPAGTPRESLSQREVVYRAAQRSLRALGVATTKHITQHFIRGRYGGLPQVMKQLERDDRIERIAVDGDKGEWFIHADDAPLLDRLDAIDFARTTLLSPFDNLSCDRARTRQLFDFDFTIEIYVPPHKRRYGYYVLPILHGDRLIGRIDPKMDREHDKLIVNAVYAEAAVPMNRKTARAIRNPIEELTTFLGAKEVVFGRRVPEGWKRDLR